MTHNGRRNVLHMKVMLALVGCALPGCAGSERSYVHLKNGQGTARVAGVTFEVAQAGQGGASHRFSDRSESPNKKQQRHEITLGEVDIVLARNDDGPWKLTVNETGYGNVTSGDGVVIDGTRGVMVNGKARSPGKA